MCLVFLSYGLSKQYPLLLAANRDEFYSRPTAPLAFLDEKKSILGGRDLQGGGTWLCIAKDGRFGAITNYRGWQASSLNPPSRGELLPGYLRSDLSAKAYLNSLLKRADQYAGFNLILGDPKSLWFYSNTEGKARPLGPGYYGLCNHLLDTPWPKLVRGKELLRSAMVEVDTVDLPAIMEGLSDSWRPEDARQPDTGIGLQQERLLSSIFIASPGYGTRSSAVISMDLQGEVLFWERSYKPEAAGSSPALETSKRLSCPPPSGR